MFRFYSNSLRGRLITLFLLVAIVPMGMVGVFSYGSAKRSLELAVSNQLAAIGHIQKARILGYFSKAFNDIGILSRSPYIREVFRRLEAYHDAGGGDLQGPYRVDTPEYKAIHEEITPFFKGYLQNYGYRDMVFICQAHGHVMYSVAKEADLGTNLKVGPFRDSGLARAWSRAVEEKQPVLIDFSEYEPSKGPAAFIGAPVFDTKGEIRGVVALQISIRAIEAIMSERTGMGESGKTYLVGPDFLMRSNSRFEEGTTILKKRVDTPSVRRALKGETGIDLIQDYRGKEVLSSYAPLNLPEKLKAPFDWAILSEIEAAEAFAPVRALGWKIFLGGVIVLAAACLLGYGLARSTARPVQHIAAVARQVSGGDLTVATSVSDRDDEVGLLSNAFHEMIGFLRRQTGELQEGAGTLSASIKELLATASQLASTSSETSSSVSEVTATVEEVRQTAKLASEKAERVAEMAEQAHGVSERGKDAGRQIEEGMLAIREEMTFIAESIMKLNEQIQRIGEIINSVTDIADQSNILSVNAAIEAAKAGEYGKGFAVVAHEVKSLADQSKEAARQVRAILGDIQKATGSAVLATERGTKAVEKGMEQTRRSAETIRTLAESMAESSQAAAQIASSAWQQQVGMDQLVQAMESIREASLQNVDGARQLEAAIRQLDTLGRNLKAMSDRFTV